ncbi:MAG: S1C family serine protease [Verrucomicrobiaceae bacterium]
MIRYLMILPLLLADSLLANSLPAEQRKNSKLVQNAVEPVRVVLQKSSAVFYDEMTRLNFVYGTVISEDGYILTKASELNEGSKFTVRIDSSLYRDPRILAVDETWDLALVKVDATGLTPVPWASSSDLPHGTWVVCNGATQRKYRRPRVGIISANKREIPGGTPAVLGVALKDSDEGVVVSMVSEKSGAEKAGLKKGDVILVADGKPIAKHDELIEVIKAKSAGDFLPLEIKRGEEVLKFEVELMARHELYGGSQSRNDQMSGGDTQLSRRRTGFPMAIQHEIVLSKRTVGGPLLTLEGQCVGMNIAYANRVENYALPVENLLEEIPKLMEQAEAVLEEEAAQEKEVEPVRE